MDRGGCLRTLMRHGLGQALTVALLTGAMLYPAALALLVALPGQTNAVPTRCCGTFRATVPLAPIAGRAQLRQAPASRAEQQAVTLHGALVAGVALQAHPLRYDASLLPRWLPRPALGTVPGQGQAIEAIRCPIPAPLVPDPWTTRPGAIAVEAPPCGLSTPLPRAYDGHHHQGSLSGGPEVRPRSVTRSGSVSLPLFTG